MSYVIGRDQKHRKNRKQLDNTTDPSSENLSPSYGYNKSNKNTDTTS